MRLSADRPIGVFDSGVGGLTVLRALHERLPGEATVYLGDTARVPYGTKSREVVERYALSAARFLLGKGIKLLVVACNTASAHALERLTAELPVPVLGVIEPGARAAAARTRGGAIAVIGTPGTVASGAYQRALAGAAPGARVVARSCPLFVPLAEEGWTEGEIPLAIAQRYLGGLREDGVDTLVLGCTHYPLLEGVIRSTVGPEVAIVDSAHAVAEAAALRVAELGIARGGASAEIPARRYFVTDTPGPFLTVAARFLGHEAAGAEHADLDLG